MSSKYYGILNNLFSTINVTNKTKWFACILHRDIWCVGVQNEPIEIEFDFHCLYQINKLFFYVFLSNYRYNAIFYPKRSILLYHLDYTHQNASICFTNTLMNLMIWSCSENILSPYKNGLFFLHLIEFMLA